MDCPKCKDSMRIAKSIFESEVGTTDVYSVHLLVCVNPECANHETDMDNPTRAEIVRNKLN